jgi:hypothetical protein
MRCSIVRFAYSINGGADIAMKNHGLPQECLLNCFVKIIEILEEPSNNNKS